jgi:hypothetical protein
MSLVTGSALSGPRPGWRHDLVLEVDAHDDPAQGRPADLGDPVAAKMLRLPTRISSHVISCPGWEIIG